MAKNLLKISIKLGFKSKKHPARNNCKANFLIFTDKAEPLDKSNLNEIKSNLLLASKIKCLQDHKM